MAPGPPVEVAVGPATAGLETPVDSGWDMPSPVKKNTLMPKMASQATATTTKAIFAINVEALNMAYLSRRTLRREPSESVSHTRTIRRPL